MRVPWTWASQRGGVTVMTAILLPALLGLAALAVDVGRLLIHKTEVQSAMDACALAAATPLGALDDPNVYDVARAAALSLVDSQIQGQVGRLQTTLNRTGFQKLRIEPSQVTVEFSAAAAGQPWIAATAAYTGGLSPSAARFARCRFTQTASTSGLASALLALGMDVPETFRVGASAVATLSGAQQACVFPAGLCAHSGSTASTLWGQSIGQRLTAVNNPSNKYGPSGMGWVDFDGGGANKLRERVEGTGYCGAAVGQLVGQPGVVSSLESSWNTRFGIYDPKVSTATSPPDFTGYSYPTGANNRFADFVIRRTQRDGFQGKVATNRVALSSAQHRQWGQQRRIMTVPVVSCDAWNNNGSAQVPILDFACVLLLAPVRDGGSANAWSHTSSSMDMEFLGLASSPATPCATAGMPGGFNGPRVPALAG